MAERKFTVLNDGRVECNVLCLDGDFYDREFAWIEGRCFVCYAYGTPTLDGGIMRGDTSVSLGRQCRLAGERFGKKEGI